MLYAKFENCRSSGFRGEAGLRSLKILFLNIGMRA